MVEAVGGDHVGGGVEAHGAVADGAGFGDEALAEEAAQAAGAVGGADVEALHFADARVEGAEGDAADGPGSKSVGMVGDRVEGEKEAAGGWGVLAGEGGEFVLEALEAEGEGEAGGVLVEEFADGGEVGGGVGREDEHWG